MMNILFDIRTATNIKKVYSDAKTGAKKGLTVFEADIDEIPDGYFIIGQAAVRQTGAKDVPLSSIILVKPSHPDLVKPPIDYELKWNDKGSHGKQDGSFWRVVPPDNYVALCDVVTNNYNEPSTKFTSKFACLRKSDVIPGEINNDDIWDDKGSGSRKDGSMWQVDGPGLAGLFKVQAGYEKPNIPVYVLPAKVVQE